MNIAVAIGSVVIVTFVTVAMLLVADRILKAWAVERAEWAEERRDLLRRIQAPQVAVARDFNESVQPGPPAIDMSDGPMGDESYWMSREELAEAAAKQELSERG